MISLKKTLNKILTDPRVNYYATVILDQDLSWDATNLSSTWCRPSNTMVTHNKGLEMVNCTLKTIGSNKDSFNFTVVGFVIPEGVSLIEVTTGVGFSVTSSNAAGMRCGFLIMNNSTSTHASIIYGNNGWANGGASYGGMCASKMIGVTPGQVISTYISKGQSNADFTVQGGRTYFTIKVIA